MKAACFLLLCILLPAIDMDAQNDTMKENDSDSSLPYYEIPQYPEAYTAGAVAARLIDGLGFRYYWATEGLRAEDLEFRPSESARTANETLEHIYGLSTLIVNTTQQQPTLRPGKREELTFEQIRKKTLENFRAAADLLKTSTDEEVAEYNLIFQRGEDTSEYPFWNLINGPIADALWHVGQVVSFRRSSGNPLHPKVSVFNGRLRK